MLALEWVIGQTPHVQYVQKEMAVRWLLEYGENNRKNNQLATTRSRPIGTGWSPAKQNWLNTMLSAVTWLHHGLGAVQYNTTGMPMPIEPSCPTNWVHSIETQKVVIRVYPTGK